MKNNKNRKAKPSPVSVTEEGIIAVCSGPEPGLYRFVSASQRKMILKDNAENRCREFRPDESAKAEEYLKRALDEAEARRFPLGYIAVRSGQFQGVYPYISSEERLKHMNRYHKYEIRDFAHFHFRRTAEIWSEGISPEETADIHSYRHKHLKNIFDTGNPASFCGTVSSIDRNNLYFEKLEILSDSQCYYESDICIYNTEYASSLNPGQKVSFSAEVYRYITEDNRYEYGVYELFDFKA